MEIIMKKYGVLFLILFGLSTLTKAQEFKKKLANSSNQKVVVTISRSEFKIIGYNGNEIAITASDYKKPPARAKGLHALYNSSVDNTGIGLSVTGNGNEMDITKASGASAKYVIKVPDKVWLVVNQANWGDSDIDVSNVYGEIDVRAKDADVKLTNVAGPVIANSVSGDITVVTKSLNQSKPTAITSVSGVIDLTLPANTKANFNMRSITGEIYTDFNMDMKNKEKNLHQIGGNLIESTINGGGVVINLKTVSSNIYVRKPK